eukprot:2762675-Amphidinium_carterae.1
MSHDVVFAQEAPPDSSSPFDHECAFRLSATLFGQSVDLVGSVNQGKVPTRTRYTNQVRCVLAQ